MIITIKKGQIIKYNNLGVVKNAIVDKIQIFDKSDVNSINNEFYVWVSAFDTNACVVAYHLNEDEIKEYKESS